MENQPLVQTGVFDLISQSGPLVQLVLLSLVLASVLCWAVVFVKFKSIRSAADQDKGFLEVFWSSQSLDDIFNQSEKFPSSPTALVFRSGFKELRKLSMTERGSSSGHGGEVDNIHRSLVRSAQSQISGLEKYLGWLATTASAAPFIGLFGTVWGIMNSFREIGATGAANLAVVAPGISEALIATAVGLAAAIPAVVAYNHFANQIKKIAVDIDCFSQDFLNIVQRGLMSGVANKK